MIRRIISLAFKRIRQYGGLSREDVAKAIGRKPQTVWRWETNRQMPRREQEAILEREANLTPRACLKIMRGVLADLDEELRAGSAADGGCGLRAPMVRASDLYHATSGDIDPATRAGIEERLLQGRMLDSLAEQILRVFEKDVARQIQGALGAKPAPRKSTRE